MSVPESVFHWRTGMAEKLLVPIKPHRASLGSDVQVSYIVSNAPTSGANTVFRYLQKTHSVWALSTERDFGKANY
jgi:hypothetical protein